MQKSLQPWSLSPAEAISALDTFEKGLTDQEAQNRLKEYGTNIFHSKEKPKALTLFLKQFVSPLIFLLVGAAILTSILHEWTNTVVIAFAVLLNALLGFYHEYHAENTLGKLSTYIKDRARVIRDGVEQEIESSLLVPGDIIKLSYGTRVPADVRIITENNLRTDESILTGESLPVEKSENTLAINAEITERTNIAFTGTLVVEGYGSAVVYATGNTTEIGKIAGLVSRTARTETPLQKGIDYLAWRIFFAVILIVIGILILGVFRGESFIPMLILSAAVAVGAVPEGLPIVLTVILAIGAERILSKKGIIKKFAAAETLGSATVIMTDKTGTLTMADMQLTGIHSRESLLSPDDHGLEQKVFSASQKQLLELALSNVDVSVENPTAKISEWTFRGRPFEVNIVKSCRAHNIPLDSITTLYTSLVLPFNSTNKFSVAQKDENYIIMGAPDILIKKSNISKEDYLKLESKIESISAEGKRIIGIGTFSGKNKKHKKHISAEDVAGIDFLGIFVFFDPIRKEVPEAIKRIESYGVKMVIVSGDLLGTVLSIAKDLDWRVNKDEALTGAELRSLTDDEVLSIIPRIKVFARVTPEDKLRIGKLYQKLGEIVAMTGDGVNDAPALKAVDIGISLGSGSDVAQTAADLVLLDDNFETISLAIEEGRKILSNIRKSFVYLLSNSFDDVFVIGGSLIFGLPLPLTALQIIWVNLFTGSLPALAFAFNEDTDKGEYSGKKTNNIFTNEVKALVFGVGLVSSSLLLVLYYLLVKSGLEISVVRSVFFVCFSSYILAIAFSFRSLHRPLFSYPIFSNKKLNYSILISIALLVGTMTIPWIRNIFELAPLPVSSIPLIIFWLIFNIFLVEITKFILRKKNYLFIKMNRLKVLFKK